jgi:hypothetical protein
MNESGRPRQPRYCSPHHIAPRTPGPRPPRGTRGQVFYTQEQIEAQEIATELAEEENE